MRRDRAWRSSADRRVPGVAGAPSRPPVAVPLPAHVLAVRDRGARRPRSPSGLLVGRPEDRALQPLRSLGLGSRPASRRPAPRRARRATTGHTGLIRSSRVPVPR
ncbi:MAG: hypothetical protein AVDCRST_MAG20-2929 [uncultured Acidimicrobiales bacterium]|uniref:Uncharacterized protein n=1 Tax=uncultured Acidimicrobiales bacterium TaxID=310071 RepID=A0A6J4IW65_9ACTN|nr:MAG: hypothetical protein AVDCRST_MAG20-2929 [uncultured Acidimicrobiales bacterium]